MVVQSSMKIFLESKKASQSFSDTHKKFSLTNVIKSKHGYKMLLNIIDAEIPISFFNINSNNNAVIDISGTTDQTAYNISGGNYTGTEIATDLSNNAPRISVTYDTAINKFSFRSSDTNAGRKIKTNDMLGVSSDLEIAPSSDIFKVAQNQANFGGIRNIYVKIKNLGIHNLNSSGIYSDIITKIPIDKDYGGVINYIDQQNNFQIIDARQISEIEVELIDRNGNPLGGDDGLGGLEWTLTLLVIGHVAHGERDQTPVLDMNNIDIDIDIKREIPDICGLYSPYYPR
jgi:hypothetical protein